MDLSDLINKSCVIGLTYLDTDGQLLKQTLLAGTVNVADEESGIIIQLLSNDADSKDSDFTLPASLAPWFKAPPGKYRDEENRVLIENPHFLVTWNIHRTQGNKAEGEHEWWNWIPNTAPPTVG